MAHCLGFSMNEESRSGV